MTADLVEWLTSVWDEDEKLARSALSPARGSLKADSGIWETFHGGGVEDSFSGDVIVYDEGAPTSEQADFIARHDPASELARIAADRKILELHTGDHDCTEIHTGTYAEDWPADAPYGKAGFPWRHASDEHFEEDEYCPTARLLAAVHADRPGFRDEWRV